MKIKIAVLFSFFAGVVSLSGQSIFFEEDIFPMQEKHVHSSSIVECPNGDLLVCWFHGSGERTADDVIVQGARRFYDTDSWSPVFLMADTPDFPDCNPMLFIDRNERLRMFWIAVLAHRWEKSILRCRLSTDYQGSGAPVWSWQDIILLQPGSVFEQAIENGFKRLSSFEGLWAEYAPKYTNMILEASKDPAKRQTGWMTRTHPLVLPTGRILLPLYSDGYNVSLVAISENDGDTWRASAPIVGLGPIQPTLVRKKDGTIVAYMRDSGGPPNRVLRSVSTDDGETWTFAEDTAIPNPGSSLEVIAVKSGEWVMVYNDTEDGRHSLAAALSEDEGKTWNIKRKIGFAPEDQKSYAYPSLIQTRDGLLHLTYSYREDSLQTIKHAVFNIDWIRAQ